MELKSKMRVSDYVAHFLEQQGIKNVFMLAGGGIMHLTDSLACNKKLNVVCLHHEQAISMAIEAYGRFTGNLGVGYFTTGPGATNALTGLVGAWLDSTPCLFISGQVKRKNTTFKANINGLRQIGVQEINILPIITPVTKYAMFIDNPEDIKYHLEKAFYLAKKGRPGPVWLDIPLDVQGHMINPENLKSFTPPVEEPSISSEQLEKFLHYIKHSSRPVILVGQGVRIAGAIDPFLKLVDKYAIPVVTTYLGVDVIDTCNPQFIGRVGIKGDRAGNLTVQNSDLLIVLGASLTIAETGYEPEHFARDAKKIVVDIDSSSHKKGSPQIDLLIEGDAKEFIEKISILLDKNKTSFDKKWIDTCSSLRKKYPSCLADYWKIKKKVSIYCFLDLLSKKLNSDDVVVTDTGSALFAGVQALNIKKGMRFITSGGLVTMGYSLPASIGVSIASGKKRVISIMGEGSFQQNLQELQSVVHYGLPLKIFVINNCGYLSIRFTQKMHFNRLIGEGPSSGVSFPDTKKIAKAYGIKFVRITESNKLSSFIDEVLRYNGPMICEIITPPDQPIVPTVASYKKEDGTMVSRPLEDMFPFLDRKEFNKNMLIKPLKE